MHRLDGANAVRSEFDLRMLLSAFLGEAYESETFTAGYGSQRRKLLRNICLTIAVAIASTAPISLSVGTSTLRLISMALIGVASLTLWVIWVLHDTLFLHVESKSVRVRNVFGKNRTIPFTELSVEETDELLFQTGDAEVLRIHKPRFLWIRPPAPVRDQQRRSP